MSRYRMVIINEVPDYDRWEAAYKSMQDEVVPGIVSQAVYRSVDDPNEVMVEMTVEGPHVVEQIVSSPTLREFLDRAGIEVYPPLFLGERVDDLSSP